MNSVIDKLKLIITNLIIAGLVFGALYYFSIRTEKEIEDRINTVNQDYGFSKGIITDYHSYKGHSLDVKYTVNGKEYLFEGAWDSNSKHLEKGDSINIRYSLRHPELIITELENEY